MVTAHHVVVSIDRLRDRGFVLDTVTSSIVPGLRDCRFVSHLVTSLTNRSSDNLSPSPSTTAASPALSKQCVVRPETAESLLACGIKVSRVCQPCKHGVSVVFVWVCNKVLFYFCKYLQGSVVWLRIDWLLSTIRSLGLPLTIRRVYSLYFNDCHYYYFTVPLICIQEKLSFVWVNILVVNLVEFQKWYIIFMMCFLCLID